MAKHEEIQVHPREFVERIARIMGPSSAAQAALNEADKRGVEVVFAVVGSRWYVMNKKEVDDAQV